jgi:hypothetical protein
MLEALQNTMGMTAAGLLGITDADWATMPPPTRAKIIAGWDAVDAAIYEYIQNEHGPSDDQLPPQ